MVWTSEYGKARYQKNKEKIKAKVAAYRKANPEKVRAAVDRCFERYDPQKIKAYMAEYYRQNAEKLKSKSRSYSLANYERDKEKRSAYGRKWRQENPDKQAFKALRYHECRRLRVPKWLNHDDFWMIREIYDLCKLRSQITGTAHHVDHIIPLQGETVSGLHVPTNLQVIPATDNLKKHINYRL